MPYTPNQWVDGDKSRPLSAARLSHMEGQYAAAMADVPGAVLQEITEDGPVKDQLNATIDEGVTTGVPPAVADVIANDPSVLDAAATQAAALAQNDAGLARVITGKNLFDPSRKTAGHTINVSTGLPFANSGYDVTDFIPVTAGEPVTVNTPRNAALYDSDRAFLQYFDNSSQGALTITPTANGYVRATVAVAKTATLQVEYGSAVTAWEAYTRHLDPTVMVGGVTDAPVQVTVSGAVIVISEVVNGKPLVTTLSKTGSANNGLNITSIAYDGTVSQNATDDITPIRTQMGTVGANHGFTNMAVFNNPDGKTVADVGSVWTDGTREYVILGLTSDNRLKVGGDYIGTPVTSAAVNPTANLTHVSGATKTGTIDYTTRTAGSSASSNTQLTPGTIARYRLSVWVDGKRVTADGTYSGDSVVIREAYEVVDYASLYDLAKANVGTPITSLPVAGAVLVQNVFTWRGDGRCDVLHTLDELKPTTLNAVGAVQAQPLSMAGHTSRRYVPGMGIVGGVNWSNGVDLTSYSATNLLPVSALNDAGQVPAFHLDTLEVAGAVALGFAVGYVPNRATSAGRSERRLTAAAAGLWDMRSTKKAYPTYSRWEDAGWKRLEVAAYRIHLSPSQVAAVLESKAGAASAYAALAASTDLPLS